MRTSRIVVRLALASLALAGGSATARGAGPPGFQIQLEGLGFVPVGSLESSGGANASDLFGSGPGFSFAGSVGIDRHFVAAVRVAAFRGSKQGEYTFSDDPGLPLDQPPPGPGPFDIERTLTAIPVHGLMQFRGLLRKSLNYYLEGGAGITTFNEHVRLSSPTSGDLFSITGYQQNFSYSFGAGFSVPAGSSLEITFGAAFYHAFVDKGDIWADGDDPKFVTGAIGVRFPRF